MIPPIAVIGDSGSGKSSSIKNLDKTTTHIINIERKPLPFREASQFVNHKIVSSPNEFELALGASGKDPKCRTIVLESLHKYFEKLMELARNTKSGYEIFNLYNERINAILEDIKKHSANKQIVAFFMPDRVDDVQPSGAIKTVRRAAVQGKVWEGKIEKEFTVVLWTDVKAATEPGKPNEYRFVTNNNGTFSAKSPPEMFSYYEPNCLKKIQDKCIAYDGVGFPEDNAPVNPLSQKPSDVVIPKESLLNTSLLNK